MMTCRAGRPAIVAVLAGWLAAGLGGATGLFRNFAGGEAAGLGGASVAGAASPLAAMWANPAALIRFDEATVELGYFGAVADATFANAVNGDAGLRRGSGHGGEFAVTVPVAGERGTVGLSLIPEAALLADWRYTDAPGGLDGTVTYGRQRHRSRFIAARGALGVGWEVSDRFAVGGSVGLVYERIDLEAPYIFQHTPGLAGFKTLLDLETDGLAWNGDVGALIELRDDLVIGLRYRTSTSIKSEGDSSGDASAQLAALGLSPARTDFHYDTTVSLSLPDVLSAGLAWEASKSLTFVAQVDWIPWSRHLDYMRISLENGDNPDLGADNVVDLVPLGWEDRFTFRAGVAYALGENWMLRGGYIHSPAAIPASHVTPLNAALAEHTVTAGLGYRRGNWSVDAGYQLDIRSEKAVRDSAYLAGEYSRSRTDVLTHWWGVSSTLRF